jgi:regulator of protease activity HflC (stomatin/prohibitin superfamily)
MSSFLFNEDYEIRMGRLMALVVAGVLGVVVFGFAMRLVASTFSVWLASNEGKAELAQAQSNRQIRILEAHAKREAAQELCEAEVIRAEGVARANQIIGDSLKGNEAYLRYLWIDGLSHGTSQVVYIPTEAGLPILEAGKRHP